MGSEVGKLDNSTIHLESLKNLRNFSLHYLANIDTLIFQIQMIPVPAISVDCDGDILLRVDPKTSEIVGVEIEDFEGYFITKYPAFAPLWKQVKSTVTKNKCETEAITTFLTIVQELLTELVGKQGSIKWTPSW